jgi:thiazole synthase
MASIFEDFQDLINRGQQNNMTRDAKLIILGQILYAVTRNELTNQQAWKLEEMLGNRQDWEADLAYVIFGENITS